MALALALDLGLAGLPVWPCVPCAPRCWRKCAARAAEA